MILVYIYIYIMLGGSAKDFVNMFICTFLDHNDSYLYFCHGRSFIA